MLPHLVPEPGEGWWWGLRIQGLDPCILEATVSDTVVSCMHCLLNPVSLIVWERSALEGHLGASVGVTGALEPEKTPPLPLVLGQGKCGGL